MRMPAIPQRPFFQLLVQASFAWGAVVVGVGLAGCTSPGSMGAQQKQTRVVQEETIPALAQTRLQLAGLHFEQGHAQNALSEVAQALQAYPRYVDAYNLQGWIHLSLHDYAGARDSFTQALALRPGDANGLYNLAWLQCQQAQFEQADRNFDAALHAPRQHAQSMARFWLGKGVCLQRAGHMDDAVRALEKALEFDPANPAVAYNFAHALHAQGNVARARGYVSELNRGASSSAASFWLGIKIERALGDYAVMQQYAYQLNKRFPDSKEWQRFERGAFDD